MTLYILFFNPPVLIANAKYGSVMLCEKHVPAYKAKAWACQELEPQGLAPWSLYCLLCERQKEKISRTRKKGER